jgi:hypothetical protein
VHAAGQLTFCLLLLVKCVRSSLSCSACCPAVLLLRLRLVSFTALVHEVVISRVGHFTCPLAAGALLLGQHPAAAAAAAPDSIHTSSSSAEDAASSPQLQQVLALKHDPVAAALNGLTTLEQVYAAVASGLLPPIVSHFEGEGVEWVEFHQLDAQQREARAQRGWYMRPVVWFR